MLHTIIHLCGIGVVIRKFDDTNEYGSGFDLLSSYQGRSKRLMSNDTVIH